MNEKKKAWNTPEAVVYGSVEDLTLMPVIKGKSKGTGDDFNSNISTV